MGIQQSELNGVPSRCHSRFGVAGEMIYTLNADQEEDSTSANLNVFCGWAKFRINMLGFESEATDAWDASCTWTRQRSTFKASTWFDPGSTAFPTPLVSPLPLTPLFATQPPHHLLSPPFHTSLTFPVSPHPLLVFLLIPPARVPQPCLPDITPPSTPWPPPTTLASLQVFLAGPI